MIKMLGIFGFLTFSFVDLLDIVMVAAILFFLFRGVRKDTTVLNILLVLAALLLLQTVVNALGMRMMTALMNALLDVGVLALIIIFQPEIRHLLNRLAVTSGITRRTGEIFNRLFGVKEEKMGSRSVEELGEAVRAMSAEKTGALIVLQQDYERTRFLCAHSPAAQVIDGRVHCNGRQVRGRNQPPPHHEHLLQEFPAA